jgi:glycosyltransferase involved in cell wall biosynthesis
MANSLRVRHHASMARNLQVLLWNPGRSPFGGHVVQIDMTARFLSQVEGISVRVSREESPKLDDVDVVHGIGLETTHIREARTRGIPVCLSVIYLSKAFRTGLLQDVEWWRRVSRRARMATVLSLAAANGRHAAKCEELSEFALRATAVYESADLLLPNSTAEAETLRRDLGVSTPMKVVPNAVDPELFPPGLPWSDRHGVLYVGRLEPHKNQLRLIRALRGTGMHLTIVGGDHPHHLDYASAVRAEAGEEVTVVGPISHEELHAFYARARVHAVPSLFETTGLVSLEGALSGCNVVSTEVGYARAYLGDLAWYCNPYDLASIRSAVGQALAAPPQPDLREHVLGSYTWEHTAEATAAAYRDLVERRFAGTAGSRGEVL